MDIFAIEGFSQEQQRQLFNWVAQRYPEKNVILLENAIEFSVINTDTQLLKEFIKTKAIEDVLLKNKIKQIEDIDNLIILIPNYYYGLFLYFNKNIKFFDPLVRRLLKLMTIFIDRQPNLVIYNQNKTSEEMIFKVLQYFGFIRYLSEETLNKEKFLQHIDYYYNAPLSNIVYATQHMNLMQLK